jgi:hypothetical protein
VTTVAPALFAALVLALAAGPAAAQPARPATVRPDSGALEALKAREEALKAAIAEKPEDVKRYVSLADFYQDHQRPHEADRVLRNALDVEPGSAALFDRRLALWLKPLDPTRIATIALEWMHQDGIHPVPVLIATGYYLRQASGARGDGTDRAERHIDSGLRAVNGALPANPFHPALLLARGALLFAQSTLVEDAKKQKELVEESQELYQQAKEPPPVGDPPPPFSGAASAAIGAMSAMPPFGPPGAVRAPSVVPIPKKVKNVPVSLRDRRMGRPAQPLHLELVIDPWGRVVQIHILRSVEGYDDAVADAVQKWEYEPTVLRGEPKTVILTTYVTVW